MSDEYDYPEALADYTYRHGLEKTFSVVLGECQLTIQGPLCRTFPTFTCPIEEDAALFPFREILSLQALQWINVSSFPRQALKNVTNLDLAFREMNHVFWPRIKLMRISNAKHS
jgi:hypothetical protein